MSAEQPPTFVYDFNSPYAHLAAARVDAVLPVLPIWQPVAFAFIFPARADHREPWSFAADTRATGIAECAARAERYGLPAMRWPPGWPVDSYSLIPLRAALVADDHGLLRPFSRAAFARNFVTGLGLRALEDVLAVAEEVGLDPQLVRAGVTAPELKRRLTDATERAISAGVYGVPSVIVGERCFWGDDQLDAAAAALAA